MDDEQKKSLHQESPDGVWILKNIDGESEEVRLTRPFEEDTITFILDDGIQLWGFTSMSVTHSDIKSALEKIGEYYTRGITDSKYLNDSEYWEQTCNSILKDVSIDFKGRFDKLLQLGKTVHNESVGSREIGIAGRLWNQRGIISFWCPKHMILNHIDWIENFTQNTLQEDIYDYKFDFPERNINDPLLNISTLSTSSSKKLTDKELSDLQAQAHVDPKAAEKLKQMGKGKASNTKKFDQSKRAGFNSVATYNHAKQFGDGVIKLGNLLTENPDYVSTPKEIVKAFCKEGDVTFGLWNDFAFYGENGIDKELISHYVIWEAFMRLKNEMLSKILTTTRDLHFIGNEKSAYYEAAKSEHNSYDQRKIAILNGRLWPTQKIISFWERKEIVAKHFHLVEKFLKQFGGAETYQYDFIDRQNTNTVPLYTSDQVIGKNNNPKMSDKEVAHLRAQAHVDPRAEKKLSAAGLGGKLKSKKSDLQAKLKASTSDGIIKMGDILEIGGRLPIIKRGF